MQEPRMLALGTLILNGESMEYQPELEPLRLKAGERADLIVRYHYSEASDERDHTKLKMIAEIGGMKVGSVDIAIEDARLLDDSHRSYLSIPFRAPPAGLHAGRFELWCKYEETPWSGTAGKLAEAEFRHVGTFVLEVG